jgi:hypothetical protein
MNQANEAQGLRPSKGKYLSGSITTHLFSRFKFDRCLAALATVLGFPLDLMLINVLMANLQRALVVPRYRAVNSRARGRNRVRY